MLGKHRALASARSGPREGCELMGSAVCIGMAGGTGSGKTAAIQGMANRLGTENVAHVKHDGSHRALNMPADRPAQRNLDHHPVLETQLLVVYGRLESLGRKLG